MLKNQSIEKIRKSLLIQLSSAIYLLHKDATIKQLGQIAKCNPSLISSLKNNTSKYVSVSRALEIAERLGIDYSIKLENRKNVQYTTLSIMGQTYTWNSVSNKDETLDSTVRGIRRYPDLSARMH